MAPSTTSCSVITHTSTPQICVYESPFVTLKKGYLRKQLTILGLEGTPLTTAKEEPIEIDSKIQRMVKSLQAEQTKQELIESLMARDEADRALDEEAKDSEVEWIAEMCSHMRIDASESCSKKSNIPQNSSGKPRVSRAKVTTMIDTLMENRKRYLELQEIISSLLARGETDIADDLAKELKDKEQ